jgi:hypothetical protein
MWDENWFHLNTDHKRMWLQRSIASKGKKNCELTNEDVDSLQMGEWVCPDLGASERANV